MQFFRLNLVVWRQVETSSNLLLNICWLGVMIVLLDDVAMGSPLGPAVATIFVGFHEGRFFDNTAEPGVYFRFVDHTFAIFSSELRYSPKVLGHFAYF